MWHYVGILCLVASSNALYACVNDGEVIEDVCPGVPQVDQRDSRMFEDKIYEFLNVTLREILRDESRPHPPFDPLAIGNFSTAFGEGNETLNVELQNIVVENLLGYVPYNGSMEPVGLKFPVALDFPNITVTGHCSLDGWLNGGHLYVKGSGDIKFSLLDTSVYLELDAGVHNDSTLFLECVALDYNVGGAEFHLEGLIGDGPFGDFLNKVLDVSVPAGLNKAKETLVGNVICPFKNVANSYLAIQRKTLTDLFCAIGVTTLCP
ncbi:uncharacterized protein LOC126234262 isoform X3 [Schistocerca nitens]|uniref:uncharacterized protein LOC126234262 isoform X2 n=1 Tax=Schistocerca nitens TaxID=7011 RepID=UPI002118E1B8|nr:uncharacterized protein LOC126234262 isoform X2 [Schistocerca nitens]XP_049798914.1 uncharacterized protein LOC126234262 isoform X3 [Schistocerca nitens]